MRLGPVIVVLCAVIGAGCFPRSHRPVAPRLDKSLSPILAADGLFVESVLLERPLGDSFLDRDVWLKGLPVGQAETTALLAENGLRATVLGGTIPQRLQA